MNEWTPPESWLTPSGLADADPLTPDSTEVMSQIPTTAVNAVTSTLAAATLATWARLILQFVPRIDLGFKSSTEQKPTPVPLGLRSTSKSSHLGMCKAP